MTLTLAFFVGQVRIVVEHFVGTGAAADVAVDAAAGVGTAFPIGRSHGRPDSNEVALVGASDPSCKPCLTNAGG